MKPHLEEHLRRALNESLEGLSLLSPSFFGRARCKTAPCHLHASVAATRPPSNRPLTRFAGLLLKRPYVYTSAFPFRPKRMRAIGCWVTPDPSTR